MLRSRRQIHVSPSWGSRKMPGRYTPVSRSRTQVWIMTSKAGLSSGHRRPDPTTSMSKPARAARIRPNRAAGTAISRSSCSLVISPRNRSSAPAGRDAPPDAHVRQPPGDLPRVPGIPRRIPAHLGSARRYLIIGHGPGPTRARSAAPRQKRACGSLNPHTLTLLSGIRFMAPRCGPRPRVRGLLPSRARGLTRTMSSIEGRHDGDS